MAKGGEVRALDPSGRAFPSLEAFSHWDGFARLHADRGVTPPERMDDVAEVAPLEAHISDDMWCVDCPDCGGAEMVWLGELKMWCHACGNAAVGGKWRPVRLPDQAAEIEAILDKRPLRYTRNWKPDETLADLVMQNAEQGDPVE